MFIPSFTFNYGNVDDENWRYFSAYYTQYSLNGTGAATYYPYILCSDTKYGNISLGAAAASIQYCPDIKEDSIYFKNINSGGFDSYFGLSIGLCD